MSEGRLLRCYECQREKPADAFYRRTESRGRGRRSICIACAKLYRAKWMQTESGQASIQRSQAKKRKPPEVTGRYPRELNGDPNQVFRCSVCTARKRVSEFYIHRKRETGGKERVSSECRACKRRMMRNHRIAKLAAERLGLA